jgi:single-strand DNA-binding protein
MNTSKKVTAMSGYMQLIIVGNVGRDPELKYLQNGVPVCNFSVAVNTVTGRGETRQEKTTWVRVAAWRELAEVCQQYLTKGRQIMVIGTVEARAYTDQGGQAQASLDMTARDVKFLGSREGAGAPAGGGEGGYQEYGGGGSDMNEIPF